MDSPTITTAIGIIVAIILTLYQTSRTEREIAEAEIERVKSVKATIVSIVEDHIINNQPIEIKRLSRLIDIQSTEVGIHSTIKLIEIIQLSELNILNSGYLDFKSKKEYKKVFDSIYKNVGNNIKPKNIEYMPLVDELLSTIKLGKKEESIVNLNRLVAAYSLKIKTIENKSKIKSVYQTIIHNNPLLFVFFAFVYILIFIILYKRLKRSVIIRKILF